MSLDDISSALRQLLIELREPESFEGVADDTPLIQERVLDSFDMISLIASIEQKFGLAFDPDDVTPENFQSIRSMAAFLAPKINDAPGS